MRKIVLILLLFSGILSAQRLTVSAPVKLDLTHYYTDRFALDIAVLNANGTGFDFTDYTGTFNIKRDESVNSSALKSFSVSFLDSMVSVDVPADSFTSLKAPKTLYYTLVLNDGTYDKTWLAGRFDYTVRPIASQINSLTLEYSTTTLSLSVTGAFSNLSQAQESIGDSLVNVHADISALYDTASVHSDTLLSHNDRINAVVQLSKDSTSGLRDEINALTDTAGVHLDTLLSHNNRILALLDSILSHYSAAEINLLLAAKYNSSAFNGDFDTRLAISSITEAQISDLQAYLTAESDPIWISDSSDYYPKAYIDALIAYYYTKTEANNLLAAKFDKTDTLDYYKRAYVDAHLNYKLNSADTLSLSNRINTKLNYSDTTNFRTFSDSKYFKLSSNTLDNITAGATNVHLTTTLKASYDSTYTYWLKEYNINNIGVAGGQGFGVGICPNPPTYMMPMTGTNDKSSDNYGNYLVSTDSSVMVWIPKFYYKIENNTASPYFGTKVTIKSVYDFPDESAAIAAGYAVPRAFIDGGKFKDGFFIDKYDWSLTNVTWSGSTQLTGIASSIKNGNPISSSSESKRVIDGTKNTYAGSFSNCISNSQTPTDTYGGAWAVAKSRGSDFAVWSLFQVETLALLSLAHAQASTSTTYNAWYDAAQTKNFPKGNNAFGVDANDNTCTFSTCDDGYWASRNEARKTGSGSTFAKTTHNGQNCGVADINGNQYKIAQGLTAIVTTLSISNAVGDGSKITITTSTNHGLVVGQQFMITSVVGLTDLNNKIWTVTDVVDTVNFKVASTSAQSYTSGGSIFKGTFYVLKESVALKNITGGNSLAASDHFADAFITNNFNSITVPFVDGAFAQRKGSGTNQVLSGETSRNNSAYRLTGAGIPKDANGISSGGSNNFGQDYYYQYYRDELCPLVSGSWYDGAGAGVWSLYLSSSRAGSNRVVSPRACLYVE